MTIVIIDDGICPGSVKNLLASYDVKDGEIVLDNSPTPKVASHGSICAGIIEKYCPTASFISIRILEEEAGNVDNLFIALRWCLGKKYNCINLSNGFSYNYHLQELNIICHQLFMEGTYIFAAQNNNGQITYPASFPDVFSVTHKVLFFPSAFTFRKSDIYCQSRHNAIAVSRQAHSPRCNSYACAYATAKFSNSINNPKQYDMLNSFLPLLDFSFLFEVSLYSSQPLFEDLIVFPFDKWTPEKPFKKDLIVIPNSNDCKQQLNTLLSVIKEKQALSLNLYWCGTQMPKKLLRLLKQNNYRYWYENIIHFPYHLHQTQPPIIYLTGTNYEMVKAGQLLYHAFTLTEYQISLFSDLSPMYLYGYHYIDHLAHLPLYLLKYCPDIVVLLTSSDKIPNTADDVIITWENGLFHCKFDNQTLSTDINNLCATIYSIFTKA